MIHLVRAGRTAEELSREFESSAQTIHNWVRQADRDEGRRDDGPTSDEREELAGLRRENRRLKEVFEFVKADQSEFAIATMGRVLGVSTSGYMRGRNADRRRSPSGCGRFTTNRAGRIGCHACTGTCSTTAGGWAESASPG